jgi:manganese efflux pump family protein
VDLVSVLFIALGLSMDAFAVAVTYGLSFSRREHQSALEISLAFGGFQAGMPMLGWLIGVGLRRHIEGIDHWIALGVLGVIGGKMLRDAFVASDEAAESKPKPLDRWTLLGLSVATSIDALAVGLALSLLGVSLWQPAVLIGCVTFAISYLGVVLGYELTGPLRRRGRRAVQAFGGLVLIGIGVRILLTHLFPALPI